ncbi:MAG: hypothetical protein UU48_C0006G0101 [Candidatus Uhrbacteria bacterium GW2011_GWF2_41_16]|jgi:hypothetical protein|uniref:Phosphoribosylanthranilate isomerase n=2 Tax=Candidatus Uhriibacteriota TaxID=1752732 RepID=A0A0G0VEE6_9BACT|nr:MAG: hypothetical protein UU35_C0007G0031 [Candidatus Uhrbacteria bacterium GW2011_GWC2_41_11]KKR98061.1 MAG: hypothetical protein UU48_C0006G0101 [Candidatus Uhrbacteria bacterium GW2011_GWF2_41_16]HBO99672.1 hypothetical protein [Candidatus Uhrbacteria bacterium]
MKTPYIGFTGFMSRTEVNQVLKHFKTLETKRRLMIGVLANMKTLFGKPPGNPKKYPLIHRLVELFPDDPATLNLVHYTTPDLDTLFLQMCRITTLAGPHFEGFQMNIAWPRPTVLSAYRNRFPHFRLILQVGHHAFEQVHSDPVQLAQKVGEYGDAPTDILLDLDGSKGKMLDIKKLGPYISEVRSRFPNIGIGIAGKLGLKTIERIKPFGKLFPRVNIDTESELRTLQGDLEIDRVKQYLEDAVYALPFPK